MACGCNGSHSDYLNNYQPYGGSLTIEEFIDIVQNDISISCALPKNLPDVDIRRIVETLALPYFYRTYFYAVQKVYYLINCKAFQTEEFTKYRYVTLPCEIVSVPYLYQTRNLNLFQVGLNAPNLSVGLGTTNQPHLTSFVTSIGDLGVYKTILDSFSDMLNQLSKFTLRFHYNYLTRRLNILTNISESHVIVEAYAAIPPEYLFNDDLFVKYVTGKAKVSLGNMYNRYEFTLPGSVKINGADLISQGKEEVKEVEEEIKAMSNNSGFFFSVKR
jgi:hypothetical protein